MSDSTLQTISSQVKISTIAADLESSLCVPFLFMSIKLVRYHIHLAHLSSTTCPRYQIVWFCASLRILATMTVETPCPVTRCYSIILPLSTRDKQTSRTFCSDRQCKQSWPHLPTQHIDLCVSSIRTWKQTMKSQSLRDSILQTRRSCEWELSIWKCGLPFLESSCTVQMYFVLNPGSSLHPWSQSIFLWLFCSVSHPLLLQTLSRTSVSQPLWHFHL